MFISANQTALTNPAACSALGSLSAPIRDNYALNATLRYIVLKHSSGLPSNNEISYTSQEVQSVDDIKSEAEHRPESIIILKTSGGYTVEEALEIENWRFFNDPKFPASSYLSKFGKSSLYIKEETKQILVITEFLTERWLDTFQSILPRLMPWFYEHFPKDEDAFFKSIGGGSGSGDIALYISTINELAAGYDFEKTWIRTALSGYSNRIRDDKIKALKDSVNSISNDIASLQQKISQKYEDLESFNVDLYALYMFPSKNDDNIVKFFEDRRKNVTLHEINDSNIVYSIVDTLEFYDVDIFGTIEKNKRSYFYEYGDAKLRSALKSIFVDEKAKFVVSATFKLTALKSLEPIRHDNKHEGTACPHPHLYFYACLGGNQSYISNCLMSGDWELAIDQTIQAVKNIHFGDTSAAGAFMKWLSENKNVKCILTKDGKLVSLEEFYEIIKSKEEK